MRPPDKRNGPGAGRPESAETFEALGGGNVGASTLPPGSVTTLDRPCCALCDGVAEPAWPGATLCHQCADDIVEQLDRRRAAELRLPPLDHLAVVA